MNNIPQGRGPIAVADMKARIAAMRAAGLDEQDLFSVLWDRNLRAVLGEGYTYEFAPDEVRQDGQRRQQVRR